MQNSHLERLESRQLLSAVPTLRLDRGTLYITGTSGSDFIFVERTPTASLPTGFGDATVIAADGTVNVVSSPFAEGVRSLREPGIVRKLGDGGRSESVGRDLPPGPYFEIDTWAGTTFVPVIAISGTRIDAGAGSDDVELSRDVALRSTLIGGSGDDTLIGSTRRDVISGGAGDDVLFGGAGGASDVIDSGAGNDVIFRYTSRATVDALNGGLSATHRGGDTFVTGRFDSMSDVYDELATIWSGPSFRR